MQKIYQMYLKLNTKKKKEKKLKMFKKKWRMSQNINSQTNTSIIIHTFAQVKPGNISENLLNAIRQVRYSLHRSKEITKKIYNNITPRLLLNLPDKIDL